MKNMKLAAAFMAALLAIGASGAAVAADAVIAIVNGAKITKEDVSKALKTSNVPEAEQGKIFPMAAEQLINDKLLDDAIAKAKIMESKEYKEKVALLQYQLARNMYIEDFMKDKITDKTVKAEYDKIKKDNKGKKEIHAYNIVVASEDEAKKVIKDLDGGAKFMDLAKQRSSGPTAKNGGDVGWFAEGEMIPEFSAAAFKIKPGTYGKEAVKTQFGWHVIMVEAERERTIPELKVVEGTIRQKLSQEALADLVKTLRAKADIKRFDADGKPVETKK